MILEWSELSSCRMMQVIKYPKFELSWDIKTGRKDKKRHQMMDSLDAGHAATWSMAKLPPSCWMLSLFSANPQVG